MSLRTGIVIAAVLLLSGCGQTEEGDLHRAQIYGQITVDEELDTLRDYSEFELLIQQRLAGGLQTDTVFHAETDADGYYGGEARFSNSGIYSLRVSRYNEELAWTDLVLAPGDTIEFTAEFPDVEQTATISSSENDLYRSYLRLQTGVNRLFRFAQAGYVTGDSLNQEIQKWSDLMWEFHLDHPNRFTGRQSAAASLRLMEGWNDSLMVTRLEDAVERDPQFIPFASRIGVQFHARTEGLDRALIYLDSLRGKSPDEEFLRQLSMTRVKLLYDSSRVDQARQEFEQFKTSYAGREDTDAWVERIEDDLTRLAPGSDIPDFSFETVDGSRLSRESKMGSPYILEFTRFDNPLYQDQFERNVAIHHIYKNYGIEFITIPFGANQTVLNAFFEERSRLWPVATPESFEPDELVEQFNINVIPTRILVDRHGHVVRKYEGTEYTDIIRGLRLVLDGVEPMEPIQP
ncbi:MAG: hypothetical protein ACQER4_09675 [Bacteroidota bacterium]